MAGYVIKNTIDKVLPIVNLNKEQIVEISGGELTVTMPPSTDFEARGMDCSIVPTAIDTSILADTFYILIQADIENVNPIYVGKSNVTTSGIYRGTQLSAGQSVTYPVSFDVYIIAPDANQKVIYTLFNGST